MKFFSFFFSILFITSAFAEIHSNSSHLLCEVKGVYKVSDQGEIIKLSQPQPGKQNTDPKRFHILASLVGETFTIDRNTGVYKLIGLRNNHLDVTIFDKGSNLQSFKVLGTHLSGFPHVQYLQVDIYGSNTNKPFRIVENNLIVSGFCLFS